MRINRAFLPLIFISASLQFCKKEEAPPKKTPVVETVEVSQKTVTDYTEFPTTLQGQVNNDIRAKIQGYISQVFIDEGQYVQAGQPLFKLETNVLSEQAGAAASGVNAARANAAVTEANVQAAKAQVQAAQVNVNKLIPLVRQNIISNVQLQTAQAQLAQAQAQLAQAQAGVQQAQANVATSRATYSAAEANIDYSIIRAPISGYIGKINLRKGSLVGPSDQTPITSISDTKEIFAYFSMNEAQYLDFLKDTTGATLTEKLKNLPPVKLLLANGQTYNENGIIRTVTGQVDTRTGTVQFRATFPNGSRLLTNGNTGKVLIPREYQNATVIPQSAISEEQGITYVYKVKKDTAYQTNVEMTAQVGNVAIIRSGLQPGEVIVAQGTGNIKDKTAVKPKMTTAKAVESDIKPIFQ